MKKIICLLLVIACSLVLFACNDGISESDFFEMIEESAPTGITIKTFHTRPNGIVYEGFYQTTVTEDGFVFYCNYDQRNTEFVEGETSIEPKEVEVIYKDGRYTVNGEAVSAAPNIAYMNLELDLTAKNVGDYTASKDGKTITTTLKKDQIKAIFGNEIAAEEAVLKVTVNGTYLHKVDLDYTTGDGTIVDVDIGYVYQATAE